MALFIGYSKGAEIKIFPSLGSDAPIYTPSYLKKFSQKGKWWKKVEVLKFLSLGSDVVIHNLSYY